MDEYQLIEITKRFRVLEDFIEQADVHLAGRQKHFEQRQEHFEHRDLIEFEKIVELRSNIEMCLELCRDDMVAMQAALRKVPR